MEGGAPAPQQVPIQPVSLAIDTSYDSGRLRDLLNQRGITAYIPIHPRQESNMMVRGGFEYQGDHVVCPQGKVLKRAAYDRRKGLLKKSGSVNAEEKWVFNVVESREVLFSNGKIMQKLRP